MPASLSAPSWTLHCDGTALPNPGRIGVGAVLTAPDGVRHTLSQALGMGCNNEAEARAMLIGVREAQRLGAECLRIHSDSRVLVDHLTGSQRTRVARLATLFDLLQEALRGLARVELHWLPQHRNQEADELARRALDLPRRTPARKRKRKRGA